MMKRKLVTMLGIFLLGISCMFPTGTEAASKKPQISKLACRSYPTEATGTSKTDSPDIITKIIVDVPKNVDGKYAQYDLQWSTDKKLWHSFSEKTKEVYDIDIKKLSGNSAWDIDGWWKRKKYYRLYFSKAKKYSRITTVYDGAAYDGIEGSNISVTAPVKKKKKNLLSATAAAAGKIYLDKKGKYKISWGKSSLDDGNHILFIVDTTANSLTYCKNVGHKDSVKMKLQSNHAYSCYLLPYTKGSKLENLETRWGAKAKVNPTAYGTGLKFDFTADCSDMGYALPKCKIVCVGHYSNSRTCYQFFDAFYPNYIQ